MKKVFIAIAAMAAAVTVSAQEKGDMYISGTLNLSTSSNVTTSGNATLKESDGTSFGLSPEFGIFVIDNLEVNVGLGYELTKIPNGYTTDDGKNLFENSNLFHIQAGLNYHIRLADKFTYAPGVKFLVGFGGAKDQISASEVEQLYNNTQFTFSLSMLKFEFRPATHFAMTFEAGSLDFTTDARKRTEDNSTYKYTTNSFSWDLNLGARIGFKCYF